MYGILILHLDIAEIMELPSMYLSTAYLLFGEKLTHVGSRNF